MPYQSKEENAGSFASGWNQIVNTLVLWSPPLFGCSRATLENIITAKQFNDLSGVMQKLGAVKVAESQSSNGKSCNHYFRVERKPIILILEEPKPVEIIAPGPLIEYIQTELKIVLS